MIKTYCDRCGAEINKHAYGWLSRKLIYVKPKLMPSSDREDWKDDDRYICPKCEDSYIHWFMNPQEDNDGRGADDGQG